MARKSQRDKAGTSATEARGRVDLRPVVDGKCETAREVSRWWHSCLCGLYDKLTLNDFPEAADLIFVLAGQMERKRHGFELYRAGIAPRLVLSVGRFEVSKMRHFAIEGIDKLITLRDKLQPDERHFFMMLDSVGTQIENVRLPRCSTYGEALGFCDFLEKKTMRRVIVVSTDVHLRRVSLTFNRVFRRSGIRFLYCRVPFRLASLQRNEWWVRPDDRSFVLKELMKLIGYWLILMTPSWICRRLMRLKA